MEPHFEFTGLDMEGGEFLFATVHVSLGSDDTRIGHASCSLRIPVANRD